MVKHPAPPPNKQFERTHCPPLPFAAANTRGPQVPLNIVLGVGKDKIRTAESKDSTKRTLTLISWSGWILGIVGVQFIEAIPPLAQYLLVAMVITGGIGCWILFGLMVWWETKADTTSGKRWAAIIGIPFFGALILATYDLRQATRIGERNDETVDA